MEDGHIKDYQLRASSILNDQSQAANSRLNHQDGYGGWCPEQTPSRLYIGEVESESIEVKLNMPVRLKGIVTQGRYNGEEKVESYAIRYTTDIENVHVLPKWIIDENTNNVKV